MVQHQFRQATPDDAQALHDVERAAGVAALGHIFPPGMYPFPSDEVLAKWQSALTEPGVRILVLDDDGDHDRLACFVAHDERLLRHLAVHPAHWGGGLARAAMDVAVAEMDDPRLWCLADNDQAIGFYEHLGWHRTGRRKTSDYSPFPDEIEMVLPRD
ncbi:GNAT family N-acetyltransferase [Promicromonospora sukumoe]